MSGHRLGLAQATYHALSGLSAFSLCLTALALGSQWGCEADQAVWGQTYHELLQRHGLLINGHLQGKQGRQGEQDQKDHQALTEETYLLPLMRARAIERQMAPKISARALLSLSSCEVSPWIAQRNSPLGRVMRPSQRLLYEARFLSYAPLCEASQEAIQALNEATRHKRATWREALYELTWRGRSLSKFFSTRWRADRLPPSPSAQDLSALRWLGGLAHWAHDSAGRPTLEQRARLKALESRLEPTLSQLSPHAGGRTLREAFEAYQRLKKWAPAITSASRPISCEVTRALLSEYLALQPTLSERVRALDALSEATAALTTLVHPPPSMEALLKRGLGRGQGSLLAELKTLSARHARALSPLLERCPLKEPLNEETQPFEGSSTSPSASSTASKPSASPASSSSP